MLASDPEMAELVALFVDELPTRVAAIQQAAADGDWLQVRLLAHQLKGAGGSVVRDDDASWTPATGIARAEMDLHGLWRSLQPTTTPLVGVTGPSQFVGAMLREH